jgi:hypothetical protein
MVDGLHIHIQNKTMKPFAIASRWARRGWGKRVGLMQPMYNVSLFRIVIMNPPCTINIS